VRVKKKKGTEPVAEALLPEKVTKQRTVALSTIFTAVKRRSLGESDDPYFVVLGRGKFRLATTDEQVKSKEAHR
jgi:hypothetical protein